MCCAEFVRTGLQCVVLSLCGTGLQCAVLSLCHFLFTFIEPLCSFSAALLRVNICADVLFFVDQICSVFFYSEDVYCLFKDKFTVFLLRIGLQCVYCKMFKVCLIMGFGFRCAVMGLYSACFHSNCI